MTDDSFKNANVSLMPGEDNTKMAATLPQMEVKGEMQPKHFKLVNRPVA